jgi:hypothetical protein
MKRRILAVMLVGLVAGGALACFPTPTDPSSLPPPAQASR